MVKCIEDGLPVMVENLGEDIDAALGPIVAKQISRKGRTFVLKLGGAEVEYNNNFR